MILMKGKVLLLGLLVCLTTVKVWAQDSQGNNLGTVTGKISDVQNNNPIEFATVVLIKKADGKVGKAAQTGLDGKFTIGNVPYGKYQFKISYVGYQTLTRDSINISAQKTQINLGNIALKPGKGSMLNEVVIAAPKSTIQMGIDKKIFAVDQSIVSEGGSATDLLQNVPSVQVDMNGNIGLRGSNNVKVLIDGRPSLIAGGNVAQILQSIPASSIESVELITNPSAKYDAEGQAGIINIVLKKNKKLGFNGSVALTAGNRDNYNANTSLSFQNSKVNIYGNYSYRYGNRVGTGFNDRENFNPGPTVFPFANETTNSKSTDKGHNVKAGIDYKVADKTTLGFSGGFNIRDNNRDEIVRFDKFNATKQLSDLKYGNNANDGKGHSYDLSLDLTQKFKKPKEELTFNAAFSSGKNDNIQQNSTQIYNLDGSVAGILPQIQQNTGNGTNKNYNLQADYTLPIGKNAKFEAGLRSQTRIGDNNQLADSLNRQTGNYEPAYSLTNFFHSKDQVHAAYINFQNQMGSFGYQVGLRAEKATLDTRLMGYDKGVLTTGYGSLDYTRLYPSVFLTQKLKGGEQFQLSYTRRVSRPDGWATNPFKDTSDPLNIRQGNPNLKPEDIHAFELGYTQYLSVFTITSSLYYKLTNDVIQMLRVGYDKETGATTSTFLNLNKSQAGGLELIVRTDVSKKWNFTTNANFYKSKISGTPQFGISDNAGFTWNANMTHNFILPYNITAQLTGNYRAPSVMAQGRGKDNYTMDLGAKMDVMNHKATISFNMRDVFNTRRWGMTTDTPDFSSNFERRMTGPNMNLTFSYRFGKQDFNFSKKRPQKDQQEAPKEENY